MFFKGKSRPTKHCQQPLHVEHKKQAPTEGWIAATALLSKNKNTRGWLYSCKQYKFNALAPRPPIPPRCADFEACVVF